MIPGVDVASYQGEPGQWRAAAGDIQWAAVKFTEVSTGGLYQNPFAAADWRWLRGTRKGRIAYCFAHPAASVTATVASFAGMCAALGLADDDGVMLDFETTDGLTAARVAQWGADVLAMMERQFRRVPLIYTYRAFAWEGNCAGLERWPLWISDPGATAGHPEVPAPWQRFAVHQWFTPPDGASGIDRDVAMFPDLPAMKTAIGRPAPRLAILEDPMLLEGKNIPIPVAIPDGTRALRFVAAESADVRVVFHAENGTRMVSLSWPDGSHEEPVPAGCHAAIVTRLDAGIGDVSAVCTG